MTKAEFEGFAPYHKYPLLFSFVDHAKQLGYYAEVDFGFFDCFIYTDEDAPIIAVKTLKNTITRPQMERITLDKTPMKVLLLEGDYPRFEKFERKALFFSASGTGVYVKNVGWVQYPHRTTIEKQKDLQYKLAPRWSEREGLWWKICTACGVAKNPEDFYDSPQTTARDPKRNFCIKCMIARDKLYKGGV